MIRLEARLRSLMVAGLAGDAAAYRQLLAEVGGLLRRYFQKRLGPHRSADIDDLVQETLMAAHARRATYDPSRPFTAWLHAIARYKLVDMHRSRRSRETLPIDDVGDLFADDRSEAAMARLDVETLLGTLPDAPAALIRKVRLEGASIGEAAAATGLSESAVKVGIHRGIQALAVRMQGKAQR